MNPPRTSALAAAKAQPPASTGLGAIAARRAILAAEGLSHRYARRDTDALVDLSLAVDAGECLGLLGRNGSGKSTALALLAGLLPPGASEIRWGGEPVSPRQRSHRARVGVVFQAPCIDLALSARENLWLAARMQGMSRVEASERAARAVEEAVGGAHADAPCKTLSGGMRRRVDLARALIHDPALLLLDEPSAGLDEIAYRSLWSDIDRRRRDHGLAVIVATHRPDEASRCDRVLLLHEGRVLAEGTPEALIDRLGVDLVRVRARDRESAKIRLEPLVAPTRGDGSPDAPAIADALWIDGRDLVFECREGAALLARVAELLPREDLQSLALQRPSLADVFVRLAGTRLDAEDAASHTDHASSAQAHAPRTAAATGEGA